MAFDNNVRQGVGVWLFNPSGQVLMGLRLSQHGFNTWSAPGGKPEQGETFIDTAVREVFEETGIKLDKKDLKQIAITDDVFPDSHFITTHYRVNGITQTPVVVEPNKCAQWRWFDLNKLPNNLFLSAQNLMKQKVL